jgi:ribose transport system permease protein
MTQPEVTAAGQHSTKSETTAPASRSAAPAAPSRPGLGKRLVGGLAFDKIGAVYVWIGIVVVFSVWVPDQFPTAATAKQILNANAITALAALAIVIPLATRVFDLSFAFTMTFSGVTAAHFVAVGSPLLVALGAGMAVAVIIGLVNAVVVVTMRIDSFIATLATGSLIQSLITMATGDTPIQDIRLSGGFAKIGQTEINGITLPVFYALIVAFGIWYLLEHTATGRRLYATGFNPDAARLAGVRIDRLRFVSLIVSAGLAGASGIVLASTLQSGSPSAGSPYLLPAFAAAFLGATQLKHGRFNSWGTIIAVLLLGTGTTGLGLANAPQWAANMFVGVVLIASLAVTGIQRRATGGGSAKVRLPRLLRRSSATA